MKGYRKAFEPVYSLIPNSPLSIQTGLDLNEKYVAQAILIFFDSLRICVSRTPFRGARTMHLEKIRAAPFSCVDEPLAPRIPLEQGFPYSKWARGFVRAT